MKTADKKNIPLPDKCEKLLRLMLPERERHYLLGDHEEIYNEYIKEKSFLWARLWLWSQILKRLTSYCLNNIIWSYIMLKNYFITGLRNIKKNKIISFINIFGLSVGIAFSILVFLFVRSEYSYDKFNNGYEKIDAE